MLKSLKIAAAVTAFALTATPVLAQDEEPRTTYAVTVLEFTDDADQNRWLELRTTMIDAARERAGLPADTVHWVILNDDWDIMIVSEMPEGMAAFDTHGTPSRAAFLEALEDLAGGEAGLAAMGEEMGGMIEDSNTIYTHTHP